MEQAHTSEGHYDTILIAGLNHMVISNGAAGLRDVFNTGLACALNIVTEGEECIGTNRNTGHSCNPSLLFFSSQHFRLNLKGLLPYALSQNIFIFVGDVNVDGVVAVGTTDVINELETQHFGMLTEHPVISLAACQTGAVNTALLAGTNTDGLATLDVAHRVGLGILQGDQGQQQVVLCFLGQILVFGDDILQQFFVNFEVVVTLLEVDAVNAANLNGGGLIIGVNLHHIIATLFLVFRIASASSV